VAIKLITKVPRGWVDQNHKSKASNPNAALLFSCCLLILCLLGLEFCGWHLANWILPFLSWSKTYIWVLLFPYILFVVNHTFNAIPTQTLQQDHPSFCEGGTWHKINIHRRSQEGANGPW